MGRSWPRVKTNTETLRQTFVYGKRPSISLHALDREERQLEGEISGPIED